MLQIYIIFSVFLLRKCEKKAFHPKIYTFVTILRHFMVLVSFAFFPFMIPFFCIFSIIMQQIHIKIKNDWQNDK